MAKVKWTLDPAHSEVTFKIRHMVIANVSGDFSKFTVDAETEDEDFSTAKVKFTADVDSVSTGNAQRDGHLKTDDFFNTAQYPQIKFTEKRAESVDNDGSYELYGDLTIRDVTREVKFDVEFGGVIKDPWGNTRAGFSVNGKINRKDFGLKWHAVTEAGGLVAGDDVDIHCNFELIRQA
ncbi:MAG TPA: YceI family protein [Puia sp.]|nr:YceI family protein [Puia sp.]